MDTNYTIKIRSGARGVRIRVGEGGAVVVTKPRSVSDARVHELVAAKRAWIEEMQKKIAACPQKRLAHYRTRAQYLAHKGAARALVLEKLEQWNAVYRLPLGRVAIRDQATRWGSCSHKGNLNFNYKVLFLPEHLVDYLVVHELCHIREMNHSERFWALVARAIPAYEACRREIQLY